MIPDALWSHYPELEPLRGDATPLEGGLINRTWALGAAWVVQRVNPIFDPRVSDDIAALTPRLRDAGVPVPRLTPAASGAWWVALEGDAGSWRVMERLPGVSRARATALDEVQAAARALGRFHGALVGSSFEFTSARRFAHDTPRHLDGLEAALREHPGHRLYPEVRALAEQLLPRARSLAALDGPERLVHGDPKLANLLFAPEGAEVTGIIDLDTMSWMTLDAELGDALRSWCAVGGEDAEAPRFDLARYEAAVGAWLEEARGWVTPPEVAALAQGTERITLELAARFAADALRESYFGWDPAVAPTRGEHNLRRAKAQAALGAQVAAARQAGLDRFA